MRSRFCVPADEATSRRIATTTGNAGIMVALGHTKWPHSGRLFCTPIRNCRYSLSRPASESARFVACSACHFFRTPRTARSSCLWHSVATEHFTRLSAHRVASIARYSGHATTRSMRCWSAWPPREPALAVRRSSTSVARGGTAARAGDASAQSTAKLSLLLPSTACTHPRAEWSVRAAEHASPRQQTPSAC